MNFWKHHFTANGFGLHGKFITMRIPRVIAVMQSGKALILNILLMKKST